MYFDLAFELRYNTKANIDQINETLSKIKSCCASMNAIKILIKQQKE